jgi:hypothetical protein
MNLQSRRLTATVLTLAATAAALLAAPMAGAGPYRVAICNPDLEARYADAVFQRTSIHYVSNAECGKGGPGLTVRHAAERTGEGRWGAWTVNAPPGTVISHVGISAVGRGSGGHTPQLLATPIAGGAQVFASPGHEVTRSRFTGPARDLTARLFCSRVGGCGPGRKAQVRVKRIALELTDGARPTIALGGEALRPGSRRGTQSITAAATDSGSGVDRFLLQVNGEPVSAHTSQCQTRNGWALRLSPCPPSVQTTFRMRTAAAPFRQGPNVLQACSADYAVGTPANRACATRRIRIDNLCPISSTAAGPGLEAHLVHTGTHGGRPRSVAVRGRLLSPSGAPVARARVCVATRVPIPGAQERVAVTPTTGADGHFEAQLPPGPSRQVRVAYWWSGTDVAERFLRLSVHAHPRLTLHPHGPLRNGRHVRFTVRLQGPAARHRWVRVQALSGHRWVEVRNGRTSARGIYRARYRFHATTGRQRYAFRAFVPSQRGYPYKRGHSEVRHVTVIG